MHDAPSSSGSGDDSAADSGGLSAARPEAGPSSDGATEPTLPRRTSTSAVTGMRFDIRTTAYPASGTEQGQLLVDPGFGRVFTDHMVTIRWTAADGWHDARLEPYGPLILDPSAAVFHYAQEVFEGLKACRRHDGSVGIFRPLAHAARFRTSARRLVAPELPEQIFIQALDLLVTEDRSWIPASQTHSLYLRPFMIATQPSLGISAPSGSFLFAVIASPAGSYFPRGIRPVSVWLTQDYTRAAPGGTGEVMCGGNYAAVFAGQQQAARHGCDQVVWLDAAGHQDVMEMSEMNIFFVYGTGPQARIMTPALDGTLLPGVTRDCLLKLAPALGIPAAEGRISVNNWRGQCATGDITEVFACDTAETITPVGEVKSATADWMIGTGEPGPVTLRLREELLGIQYGDRADPYGWIRTVDLS